MEILHGYWLLIIIAAALLIILAWLVLRPRQRVSLTDTSPLRPHMPEARPAEGRGIAGEAAAATSDIAGDLIEAPVHQALEGDLRGDDLCKLKGVGPRFAKALRGAGFQDFGQLARLSPVEIERLDDQLGPFRGRLERDRVVEQAAYLARGDFDGFEQKFGKL